MNRIEQLLCEQLERRAERGGGARRLPPLSLPFSPSPSRTFSSNLASLSPSPLPLGRSPRPLPSLPPAGPGAPQVMLRAPVRHRHLRPSPPFAHPLPGSPGTPLPPPLPAPSPGSLPLPPPANLGFPRSASLQCVAGPPLPRPPYSFPVPSSPPLSVNMTSTLGKALDRGY